MRLHEIQIRDPFVLPLATEGAYYLFGSTDENIWEGPGGGFDCYRSRDLEEWEGPFPVFRPAPEFWGVTQFWAPEAYFLGGRYCLIATFNAPQLRRRGSQFLVSERPEGPYLPHGEPVTPCHWECLDATLWVERDGSLWTVFSQEWQQVHDGTCWLRALDGDLAPAGRPKFLFNASEAPWARPLGEHLPYYDPNRHRFPCYVSDGPFLHRLSTGALLMLWSSMGELGYAMGQSRSVSGRVEGPWEHQNEPLIADDGGHGMVFRGLECGLFLAFHRPNVTPLERAVIVPVREKDGWLVIGDWR